MKIYMSQRKWKAKTPEQYVMQQSGASSPLASAAARAWYPRLKWDTGAAEAPDE